MSQNPPSQPAKNDDVPAHGREQAQRARLVLLLATVGLTAIGVLALLAVLLSAWMGVQPWAGFMVAAYFCLPLGFLFMILSIVVSITRRGRS